MMDIAKKRSGRRRYLSLIHSNWQSNCRSYARVTSQCTDVKVKINSFAAHEISIHLSYDADNTKAG